MSQSTARRPPRDPAAPKRNMSAYLLYQNAMRDTFKQQNPGMTFGQLSKYTSAMYAEMQQLVHTDGGLVNLVFNNFVDAHAANLGSCRIRKIIAI